MQRIAVGLVLFLWMKVLFAFPSELSGTWIQPDKDERGVMRIVVTEHGTATLKGSMEIRGSPYCPHPIQFRGIVHTEKVTIESDEEVVCGYRGKLTGEVVKEKEEVFIGSFQYTYFGFTWARGTFRVMPLPQKE